MDHNVVKLIECPRDAMQGWKNFIPTEKKIQYINSLLKVGFDTIDAGSFVSSKVIPQMADTKTVISNLELENSPTKILTIIANVRGAEEAADFKEISYLGFPFSVSETFQFRNTNSSIKESFTRVEQIQKVCTSSEKKLVIYISMGFGNPYGDPFSEKLVFDCVNRIVDMGVTVVSLADTVGVAQKEQVLSMTSYLVDALPWIEIGVHLHSTHENWKGKLDAAFVAGVKRFDGALRGIGGCPMANDDLVGNINTEWMIDYFEEKGLLRGFDKKALQFSLDLAAEIFI